MSETNVTVEDYDLGQHAVVEASAGTGKTHTIEQLVLRLLIDEAVPLDKILVVTFTEKATGELKERLRKMLVRAVQNADEYAMLLQAALDQFDQAPIFTIHGFCQRLLQEYALEQGQDFRADLVDDVDLLELSLREIQRKHWRGHFGDQLQAVLEKAGYSRDTAEKWDRKVLEIAKSYKPGCGHQLRPALVPDWWQRLNEPDQTWAGQLEIFTINALHEHLRNFKRQRGLYSFDDMIANVAENLDVTKNADAENLLQTLRDRYQRGIVDEFQDTDPLQWSIFRRIFLEGGDSKLFVVGDPKQAIFNFRGADLPTYLHAAKEMKDDFGASDYGLVENWRSDPDLLEGLNCLFGDGDWFQATGIRYAHVHAPDDDKRLTRLHADLTNRTPLTIVDLVQWPRLKTAHKQFARFTVGEIARLLAGGNERPMLSFSEKAAAPRPVHAGDICILVNKRTEAEPFIVGLESAGIPYSFYKQTGLWQSEEATHLQVLLQSLARPDDRASFRTALLTCFFRVKPADLIRAPDVPTQHPAHQLFQAWIGFAENRQWSALCGSLLADTGLLFPLPGDAQADRRLTNMRHLLRTLEQAGHGANLDLLGVLDWLKDRREQRDPTEGGVHPVEIGQPKVKIMTIHASKGLEFPIVFLGGGFTQGGNAAAFASYRDDAGRCVFNLTPDADPEAQERVKLERLSEQRRLLYVALTRPIFKLYVPKVKINLRNRHWSGPVGTVLLPALEQSCPDKLGPLIAEVVTPPLQAAPAQAIDTPMPPSEAAAPFRINGPLFPSLADNLSRRRIVIRSFSSMSKHHLTQVGVGSSFGDLAPPTDDEAEAPLDRDDPLRGPVFGDMVHNVLEDIDFAEVGRAAKPDALFQPGAHARKLMDQQIKDNIAQLRTRTPIEQLEQACRQQIAQLVWHALHTPLAAIGGSLCRIDQKDRLPEVEFLLPERPGEALPADKRWEDGFVTGFMDLLFRKDGKYFLVDWKTNVLPGYSREHLERCMNESDYHRQYRLYVHALRRWLGRMLGTQFSFGKRFGGVYYLFVRGLNGRDETTGVYFHRPTEAELDLTTLVK